MCNMPVRLFSMGHPYTNIISRLRVAVPINHIFSNFRGALDPSLDISIFPICKKVLKLPKCGP
jgi:hypothetical protein